MKIHKSINKVQLFSDTKPGDVFEFAFATFLRLNNAYDWNCVNLETGELSRIASRTEIIIYSKADLQVED
jgi:hypothetical protein